MGEQDTQESSSCLPTVKTTEKTRVSPSSDVTKTATIVSPRQSPAVPLAASDSQLLRADRRPTNPKQPIFPTFQNPSTSLSSIRSNNTQTRRLQMPKARLDVWDQAETKITAADSDSDNLDKFFEEAWESGNSPSLADGSPLPWSSTFA